jgi:hypothetical protein
VHNFVPPRNERHASLHPLLAHFPRVLFLPSPFLSAVSSIWTQRARVRNKKPSRCDSFCERTRRTARVNRSAIRTSPHSHPTPRSPRSVNSTPVRPHSPISTADCATKRGDKKVRCGGREETTYSLTLVPHTVSYCTLPPSLQNVQGQTKCSIQRRCNPVGKILPSSPPAKRGWGLVRETSANEQIPGLCERKSSVAQISSSHCRVRD